MKEIIAPFLELLHEIYVGSATHETWVIDRDPGFGFSRSVRTVTAKQASTPLVAGGTTIAAHTNHLRWSLSYAMEFYKGNMPQWDWKESWKVKEVDESSWQRLQDDLVETYRQLKEAINGVTDWTNPKLVEGTLALLPHAAYHLGAVKQMMHAVQEK